MKFHVYIDGRYAYPGIYACSIDAVIDAICLGARKVKVVPA
jgi:hypothetical protein